MTQAGQTLNRFRRNVHSQNGEDGVIEELTRRLRLKAGQFVEFGAWDGKYLSNTFRLLSEGWRGVYIEGESDKFKSLLKTAAQFPGQVTPICAYVTTDGENALDRLLAVTEISRDFDLLSIDIDSFDWQVWNSLRDYRPKIVIIEVNSLPPGIEQTYRGPMVQGSSFTSTVQLGRAKGYTLVCHTGNCVFVRNDLIAEVGLSQEEIEFPETLFDYSQCLATVFFSPYFMRTIRWMRPIYRLIRKSLEHRSSS